MPVAPVNIRSNPAFLSFVLAVSPISAPRAGQVSPREAIVELVASNAVQAAFWHSIPLSDHVCVVITCTETQRGGEAGLRYGLSRPWSGRLVVHQHTLRELDAALPEVRGCYGFWAVAPRLTGARWSSWEGGLEGGFWPRDEIAVTIERQAVPGQWLDFGRHG